MIKPYKAPHQPFSESLRALAIISNQLNELLEFNNSICQAKSELQVGELTTGERVVKLEPKCTCSE